MSSFPKDKDIYDYIRELSERVQRLETGGRPIVSVSPPTTIFISSLGAGDFISATGTLSWSTAIEANPGAVPFYTLFVDALDDDNIYPDGANLTSGMRDLTFNIYGNQNYLDQFPNQSPSHIILFNNDSSSHDYWIRQQWTYISGQTGGGV